MTWRIYLNKGRSIMWHLPDCVSIDWSENVLDCGTESYAAGIGSGSEED